MSQLIEVINLTEVADILRNGGFREEFDLTDPEAPFIWSGSQGLSWQVNVTNLDTEDGRSHSRVDFFLLIPVVSVTAAENICEQFNSEVFTGQAHWHVGGEDNDLLFVIVDHASFLLGGVTKEWLAMELDRWDSSVQRLAELRILLSEPDETEEDEDEEDDEDDEDIDEDDEEKSSDISEDATPSSQGPKNLGDIDGVPVYVKDGPNGHYIQWGNRHQHPKGEGKPKFANLLSSMTPDSVTLDQARQLLTLPRVVGKHPESKAEIVASAGKFGPYLRCGQETRSLQSEEQLFSLTLGEAIELLNTPKKPRFDQK